MKKLNLVGLRICDFKIRRLVGLCGVLKVGFSRKKEYLFIRYWRRRFNHTS